jgi:polyisoprenoid-binding protein YceI
MRTQIPLMVALAGLVVTPPCSAASYMFDMKRTEVRFTYTMGFSAGHGRFTSVNGTVQFDEAAPDKTQVQAVIETGSLVAEEPVIESELKGSEFFNVVEQPQMRFASRAVHPLDQSHAEMYGDLTVNGITRPVQMQVLLKPHSGPALKYSQDAREFVARTRIRRSAFAMTSYASMVGDEVEIEIDAIVRKVH